LEELTLKLIEPFLITNNSGFINLTKLGGGMDYRQEFSKIYGNDFFPNDGPVFLILTRIHDQEADIMGLELAEKNINYIRINIDDLPKNLFLHHQMEDGELETYIEGTGFNRLNIKQIKLAWFRLFGYFYSYFLFFSYFMPFYRSSYFHSNISLYF